MHRARYVGRGAELPHTLGYNIFPAPPCVHQPGSSLKKDQRAVALSFYGGFFT